MIIYISYVLAFIALSGLGVTFLNPESLLALCFFIFFTIILQNSDSVSQSLEQSREAIERELLNCMIAEGKAVAMAKEIEVYKKLQCVQSVEQML